MLGPIVNALAIIAGSLLGLLLKHGIKANYRQTIMDATALAILVIGTISAIRTEVILLMVISLAIGSLIGEILRIEDRLNQLGTWIERKSSRSDGTFTKGFVTASLVYCVGSMAIVGSIESGLSGNYNTLFAKSVLDGIISIFFASTLGIGVLFSAFAVLIYEGLLTLGASGLKTLLTDPMILEVSAVGGVLIMALGINQLGLKKIRVGNMLPAIFMPMIYYLALALFF